MNLQNIIAGVLVTVIGAGILGAVTVSADVDVLEERMSGYEKLVNEKLDTFEEKLDTIEENQEKQTETDEKVLEYLEELTNED